jgi:hypothetical protein
MMRRLCFALAIAVVVSTAPGAARACACCTNPGQRYVEVEKLDAGRLDEIERVRFGNDAQLHVGEAGLETIEGIQEPAERYDLSVNWDKTHPGITDLSFTLANPGGRSGTLSLRLPQKISIFEVDPRDSPDQGTGPVLYKEWKLSGEVTGTGAFSGTNSPKQVLTLILQGRGNSCTGADSFTHWSLVMQGPKANYLFFGALEK